MSNFWTLSNSCNPGICPQTTLLLELHPSEFKFDQLRFFSMDYTVPTIILEYKYKTYMNMKHIFAYLLNTF